MNASMSIYLNVLYKMSQFVILFFNKNDRKKEKVQKTEEKPKVLGFTNCFSQDNKGACATG